MIEYGKLQSNKIIFSKTKRGRLDISRLLIILLRDKIFGKYDTFKQIHEFFL